MATGAGDVDLEVLQGLVPLNLLSRERLYELVAVAGVETVPAGGTLFRLGDQEDQSIYLLSGAVTLYPEGDEPDHTVWHGSPEAKQPLEDRQPRRATAIAATETQILRLENAVLDYLVAWDQLSHLHAGNGTGAGADEQRAASQTDDPQDSEKLSSLPFRSIPSANLDALAQRMERVPVKAGDPVVTQGERGEYYYVIDEGKAVVTRQVTLAELGEGAAFGEEALLMDAERNASVTMTTDGTVLRLSKEDFNILLRQPMVRWLDADEARDLVNEGASWLDVRHAREFNYGHLPEALNLPLDELRLGMNELDPGRHYVCYCQTGQRSTAAAFVLRQNGFQVSVLRGGLRALPGSAFGRFYGAGFG